MSPRSDLAVARDPRPADLRHAAEVLNAGERVGMLIGRGARGAADEVVEVAEALGAGVAKALNGRAVLPDDLPFVTGSIGLLGAAPAARAQAGSLVARADRGRGPALVGDPRRAGARPGRPGQPAARLRRALAAAARPRRRRAGHAVVVAARTQWSGDPAKELALIRINATLPGLISEG
jgi:hypothetical protein